MNNISLEQEIENLFSEESQKKDKNWMQDEAEREKEKGTKGSLREYFKLKDDEHITIEMIENELKRLKGKYPNGKYPDDVLRLIRRLNLAKTLINKSKNTKKKK